MNRSVLPMGTIVLVSGFWLGAWAWAEVTSWLRAGLVPVPPFDAAAELSSRAQ